MLINLSELFPVEGKSKTYTVPLEMTHFKGPDGSYKVVEKEPVTLVITNQGDRPGAGYESDEGRPHRSFG